MDPISALGLDERSRVPLGEGGPLVAELRGDCHSHTTWSDGGASLRAMAETAMTVVKAAVVQSTPALSGIRRPIC